MLCCMRSRDCETECPQAQIDKGPDENAARARFPSFAGLLTRHVRLVSGLRFSIVWILFCSSHSVFTCRHRRSRQAASSKADPRQQQDEFLETRGLV